MPQRKPLRRASKPGKTNGPIPDRTPIPDPPTPLDQALQNHFARQDAERKKGEPEVPEAPPGTDVVPLYIMRQGMTLGLPDGTLTITLPRAEDPAPRILVLDPQSNAWMPVVLSPAGTKWVITPADRIKGAGLWVPGDPRPA